MHMHVLDWMIVASVVIMMVTSAWYCRRFVSGTADFLAANRLAGKYLLTVSEGATGAIGTIAVWQMIFNAGLSTQWWAIMSTPIGLFVALTGFVGYRLRETRALTLAQFFEMRYGRKFRFFSGLLCWLSGLINYGVFPAVAGRLFIAMFGLPEYFFLGEMKISAFAVVMASYLSIAVYIACSGGQIALMVSDFLQESFCKIVLIAITFFLLFSYAWPDIFAGLIDTPPGKSMINPFDTDKVRGFNVWYFLIGMYGSIYSVKAWQGNSGYNAAARSPHDAQMAGILSKWRDFLKSLCVILPPIIAYVVLTRPAFATTAAPILESLEKIDDLQVRNQMMTPMFMTHVLPVGLLGMMAAMFVSGVISVDDTYTHAWGSIFIQDVVMPCRKKPFTPKTHLLLLRFAVIGVALFGFIFSLLFPFKDAILMFFALSGAIYLGGAGITIIGGLYWRRGTTAGAFSAMTVGTILAFGGMLVEQLWADHIVVWLLEHFPHSTFLRDNSHHFFLSGQIIYFIAMLSATTIYITVSLLTCHTPYNLERLLNRDSKGNKTLPERSEYVPLFQRISRRLGLTSKFSRFDKFIFFATFFWTLGWWLVFLVVTLLGVTVGITREFWSFFWCFKIWLSVVLGIVCTAWMVAGGFRDLAWLFRDLRVIRRDDSDDGFIKR